MILDYKIVPHNESLSLSTCVYTFLFQHSYKRNKPYRQRLIMDSCPSFNNGNASMQHNQTRINK